MTLFDLLLFLFLFSAGFVSFFVGFYQIWRARRADALGGASRGQGGAVPGETAQRS